MISVPVLPAGRHFLDVWIKTEGKIEQFGSVGFTVTDPVRITAVEFDTPFHRLGDVSAEVMVKFSAPPVPGSAMRIMATDTYGRRIADVRAPVVEGAQEAKATLPMAHWVWAELTLEDTVLDQDQELLITARSHPPEYPALLWEAARGGLHGLRLLRRQRDIGFNLTLTGAGSQKARFAALADMQLVIYATRIGGVSDGQDGWATNPDYMANLAEEIVNGCRVNAQYGPYVYSLGDECSMGSPGQRMAPTDVAAYREFLEGRYADIGELNRAWQTTYGSFREIEPIDWAKAEGAHNYPRKHERMAFFEMLYAKMMHALDDALTRMDPGARVGAEGSHPGDLELTLEGLEMWGPYHNRRIAVLLASLADKDVVRGMWWGGYHGAFFDRWTVTDRFWTPVFEGVCNTNYFFNGQTGNHEANCASDMSWADYFERGIPELHTIYETPGPLIAAAEPADMGVALLWSQASEHMARLYMPFAAGKPADDAVGVERRGEMGAQFAMLHANGISYQIVTDRQVDRDGLDPARVRLLLLPMTTDLRTRTAERLAEYVRGGGVLLSTGSTGLMDGHCSLQAKGQLDELLGVRRAGGPNVTRVRAAGRCNVFGTEIELQVEDMQADASLQAAEGQTVLAAGHVPLIVARELGRGAVVHLNGCYGDLITRGAEGVAAARALTAALLGRAGVPQPFTLLPPGGARVYMFTLGKVRLLSVIRTSAGPLSIKLASTAHVYDAMRAKSLGRRDTIIVPEDSRGYELFCLANVELAAPALQCPPKARRSACLWHSTIRPAHGPCA